MIDEGNHSEGNSERPFREILGSNLRKLRKINKLTQVELGDRLGYKSKGTISQIEQGKRGMDNDQIYKAAETLGVPPSVLFSPTEWSQEELEMAVRFMIILKKGKDDKLYEALRGVLKLT